MKPILRRYVTFAPLPPSRRQGIVEVEIPRVEKTKKGKEFRDDYSLGDAIRHRSHMIIKQDPEMAFQSINSLKDRDFCFVKRGSDGAYAYAILACRIVDSTPSSPETLEESMVFVTCGAGSRIKLRREEWIDHVRRVVSTERRHRPPPLVPGGPAVGHDCVLPSIISFVPDADGADVSVDGLSCT